MPRTIPPPFHRAGTGTPLLLLHCFTGSWRIWKPVLDPLEAHHDVFALTLAGHNGGPAVPKGAALSVAMLADEVERSLDTAGIDAPHVCGNSLGGWLSLELARRGRARSVVALSPAGGWGEAEDLRRATTMIRSASWVGARSGPFLRAPVLASNVRRRMLHSSMERGDRMPADHLLQLLDDLGHCSIVGAFMAATERDGPFTGDMSHVMCPIRIAWGQNDRMIPPDQHARPLLDRVPNAEFVVMPGVGHVPMYDDPLLVTATILEVTLALDATAADTGRGPHR